MALNKFMHPRNPFYNKPPDFDQLANEYPEFQQCCTYSEERRANVVDFQNPKCLKALCCVLLKHLYALNVDVPLDHLIPRIPQRINYVLWIEDLLGLTNNSANGIDIGCGASCVFGLISCSIKSGWRVLASEINDENIEWANRNVIGNNLQERIAIQKVEGDTFLKNLLEIIDRDEKHLFHKQQFDFTMCNPPFYSNESELSANSSQIRNPNKRPRAKSVNTARSHESVYEDGGEVAFVKQMIDESVLIGERIKIYSVMLGKKKSLCELRAYLTQTLRILNVSETQFCQGRTMRWGLAWSFCNEKLQNFTYFKSNEPPRPTNAKPVTFQFPSSSKDQDHYYNLVNDLFMNDLKFESTKRSDNTANIVVYEKTWCNQRAKRRKAAIETPPPVETLEENHTFVQTDSAPSRNEILRFFFEINISTDTHLLTLNLTAADTATQQQREYLHQILQYLKNNINK